MTAKQNILIVDDKKENLIALRQALEGLDADIVEARSGNEALSATLDRNFAVAILDIMMPGMGGYELAGHLRRDDKTRVIPIVFLTASYADEQHIFEGYEAGGIDYIVKPVDPRVLLGKVRVFLELDRYRQELRQHRDQLEALVGVRTAQLEHLNDVLRSIRDVNQLIVHEKCRDRLIRGACGNLISTRGFQGAWIVLNDRLRDGVDSAQVGFEEAGFVALVDRIREGCLPRCWRQNTADEAPMLTRDPAASCDPCPLSQAYRGNSALTVALRHEDREFGCLGVLVPPVYADDEQETSLLREIAGDIAFALHGFETESERRKAEETLQAIFESASDGILLANVESGRFVVGNDAICRMLGYSHEEIHGLSVADIHPVEDLDHVRAQFERQVRGEITLATDIPMRCKDGTVFPADVNSTPLELDGHRHLVGVFRDITHRRASEQKIRRLLEQQTHINALALELGDLSRIENIYESVFRHVKPLMDAEAFLVSFYDQETRTLTAEYAVFDGRPFDVSKLPPIPLESKGRGTQSEVVHTGEPLYLPHFRKAREKGTTEYTVDDGEAVAEGPPPEGSDQITRSALLAPLKVEGRTIGVMQVQSHRLDGYTQEDIDLLTGLASVTAVAVSNSRLVQEIRDSLDSTIRVVARTVEIRDPYTSGHQRRVTELACAVAEGLGLPRDVMEGLRVAGLLHDIGKMAVPAEVLSKPTKLSDVEFSLIRVHPQVGHDLLAGVRFSGPVAQIVLQHHERMDGSGYPQGLRGNDIVIEARILAVADVVEAMSSHRPYRPALGMEAARAELQKGQERLYDSDVVRACLRVLEDGFQFSPSDESRLV